MEENRSSSEGAAPRDAHTRKPYTPPTVTRVPLVPEELLVASCSKTPSVCHFHGVAQPTKS